MLDSFYSNKVTSLFCWTKTVTKWPLKTSNQPGFLNFVSLTKIVLHLKRPTADP